MKTLKTIIAPDERLSKKAMRVEKFDEALKTFAQDMILTASDGTTVGLSSIQVEDDARFNYHSIPEGYRPQGNVIYLKNEKENIILINTEIMTHENETAIDFEGCVSVPYVFAKVERYKYIKVKFQDLDGQEHIKDYENWLARCLQHEIDHSNGMLFPQRLPKFKQPVFWQEYSRKKNQVR